MLVAAGLALPALGVTGFAGLQALTAADALESARAGLAAVQDGSRTSQELASELERAHGQLVAADRALSSWPVDVVAAVPLLGRSWDAERAVATAAREVVAGATVLADGIASVRAEDGAVELARLAAVRDELTGPTARAEAALAHLEQAPLGLTPPQVRDGVEQALHALGPAVETLDRAHAGLGLMSGLLGGSGPRSVLVMLQNNAELRGTGGYAATFATGRLEEGRLSLEPLRDVYATADRPAVASRVPAPAEYLEDYAALAGNTTIWRSWNMSPHVPDSALVGARVAGVLLGEQPDVVVLLDVPAMASLAALGGGAIDLPNGADVSPAELTEALLVDAYAEAGAAVAPQMRRRADLQAAASEAVERLLADDVSAGEAARAMRRLAAGRHLSVWSAREEEQDVLVELGLAGAVSATDDRGDLSHVSVNNIGGNKLDLYVDREIETEVVLAEDEASVVQRVRFSNHAPDGLVPYVAGFDRPGVVVSRVELSLPVAAEQVSATVDGKPWQGALHAGPSRQRLITHLELARGASSVLEVRYRLPVTDGAYRLRLIPQPLAHDADLRLSVRAAPGRELGGVQGVAGVQGDGRHVVPDRAPLTVTRDIAVSLEPPVRSTWQRLRDWWNSPVSLG